MLRFFFFFLLIASDLYAQYQNTFLQSQLYTSPSSIYFPSVTLQSCTTEVYFPVTASGGAGNNFMNYPVMVSAMEGDRRSQSSLISAVTKRNISAIGGALSYSPVLVSFMPLKGRLRNSVFTLTIRDFAEGAIVFPNELALLIFNGNKPFAEQTVNISPLTVDMISYRESAIGFSTDVIKNNNYSLRVGARIRYLIGASSVQSDNLYIHLFTEKAGEYVQLKSAYSIKTVGAEGGFGFQNNGDGFAGDFGFTFSKGKWRLKTSLIDIGYISFKRNIKTYSGNTDLQFSGFDVSNGFDNIGLDTLEEKLTPTISDEDFTRYLNPKVIAQGSFHSVQLKDFKTGIIYTSHNIYFTACKDFRPYIANELTSFISLGYTRSFGGRAELGSNLTYGGYYRYGVGLHAAYLYKHFVLGVGSSNLITMILPYGKGTDLSITALLIF